MSAQFPATDQTWQWDNIFEGGVGSEAFREEVRSLEALADEVSRELEALVWPSEEGIDEAFLEALDGWVDRYFELTSRHSEARSFAMGMATTHANDPEAIKLPTLLDSIQVAVEQIGVGFQMRLKEVSPAWMEALLKDERFSGRRLWLRERKRDGDQSMGEQLEMLAVELNQDGMNAWARTYREVLGRVQVEVEGRSEALSVGQAKNLLSDRQRSVRRAAYEGLQEALGEVAPVCASALTAMKGAQRTLFERRGGDYLTEPLQKNRVKRSSIEAMMEGAGEMTEVLDDFLATKADYHGWEEGLQWYDLSAPAGEVQEDISYEEGQRFIVEQVERFSPKIAEYCKKALSRRWVEAEDRPGKRQGGYCTTLPRANEIRIFMTFGNTPSSVTTLAHELGHGYHAEVIKDLPLWQRKITMGLAESASTLVEAIVEEAALEKASTSAELALLDRRLMRGVTFLANIPARFDVEVEMHRRRAEGVLDEQWLRQCYAEAFEEHYGATMASVDPLGWVSTPHYYMTHMPFYNFPYTFGYLFSRAVLKRARTLGEGATEWLDELLRDTGRLSSEEVAKRHLDADLEDPRFWFDSAKNIAEDLSRYKSLVNDVSPED